MKVLVLSAEPVDATMLRAALGDEVEGAEVLVVSPALHSSPITFWVSDDDEAIAKADAVQEETVERLEEEGIDAAGDTGEADPIQAVEDALVTFPAERIVVFSHPGEQREYREEEVDEISERFELPVVRGTISR
jgi:hypothetical protein